MKRFLSRLSWLSGTTLANAVVSLLLIPATISVAGATAWGAIAVGQSVGSIATLIVALGWGYNGPSLVARSDLEGRWVIAANSAIARVTLAPLIIVPACIVAYLLAPAIPVGAVLACATVSIGGLGMSWFFIGESRPDRMFLFDGVPRWGTSVIGVALLLSTEDVYALLLAQLAGAVVAVTLGIWRSVAVAAPARKEDVGFKPAFRSLRKQAYAGVTVVTASSFASAPTLVVAALAPTAVPAYALGERIVRLLLMALTPFLQWMQGWLPQASERFPRERRIQLALRTAFVVAPVMCAAALIVGPFAGFLLSGGSVDLPPWLALAFGMAVAGSLLSRVIGMGVLLSLGLDRPVATSAILGAAIGVPLLFALVPSFGALGAASALAIAEVSVATYQYAAYYRSTREGHR